MRPAALVGVAALCATAPIAFHPDGPPTAHTGGFGEKTCLECHTGTPLNAPGATLAIESLPSRWRANTAYRIVVALRRDSLTRGGFELSARFADGTRAGTLAPGDTLMTMMTADSVTGMPYVHHTRRGTRAGVIDGTGRWVVRWLAPASGRGPVVFNAAAVASNDDDSNLGDAVVTAEASVRSRH